MNAFLRQIIRTGRVDLIHVEISTPIAKLESEMIRAMFRICGGALSTRKYSKGKLFSRLISPIAINSQGRQPNQPQALPHLIEAINEVSVFR